MTHLHGAGEHDFVKAYPQYSLTGSILIEDLMDRINADPDYYESYVVMPIQSVGQHDADFIKGIVDRLVNEEAADPDRIYITGVSMGGFGTCNFIYSYPDIVACAVPICGTSISISFMMDIVNIPIRIYHSDDDDVVDVSMSREFYNLLINMGSEHVEYFECTGYMHACWECANRTDMLDWMYLQNRKSQTG